MFIFRSIARHQGSRYLQQQLNLQLSRHIRNTLPDIYEQLRQQLTTLEKQLADHSVQHNKTRTLIR